MEVINKQPSEKLKITFDFSDTLLENDSLTGTPTLTSDTGITVTSTAISGDTVTCFVSGGTTGSKYKIEVVVDTVAGEILEGDVQSKVQDL
jgi:hypothetical protein